MKYLREEFDAGLIMANDPANANLSDLDLAATPVEQPGALKISVAGAEVPGHRVSFADLSVGPAQPSGFLKADAASTISTHLFEEDHEYAVVVEPTYPKTVIEKPAYLLIKWTGQTELDVPDPDAAK